MNKKIKIAHAADIHVRFGSRHEEMVTVLNRTIEDINNKKPDRIVLAGDLFHMKINMSPNSVEIISNFLIKLKEIAHVDIIAGNHDLNLQQLEQGDSITPIIQLLENGFIVEKDAKELPLPQKGFGIYFYKHSGFYNINKDIIYGVYSCIDDEILNLNPTEKDPTKKYIALYHGPINGARMDNGYQDKSDHSIKPSVFNGFDIVMCGDFHEYQIVQEYDLLKNKPIIVYPGSILQNNYGESIGTKGYVLWNLDDLSCEFRDIKNDYGFSKIIIAKGENIEERLGHLKFSHNKKKTRVYVVIEEYEENFSQERENQIAKSIKEKHGCEIVKVEHSFITKDITIDENSNEDPKKQSEEYIKEFIESGTFECSDEELLDVLSLHNQINKELEINESEIKANKTWYIDKIEISNIFSFPIKPTTIDLSSLAGITGLFGENYNGKSNVIKAIVWGLYKEILGGGDSKFLINIYTDSNQGYVEIYLTIDDKKYVIKRNVKTTKHKDGRVSNSYGIQYKSLEFEYDEEGNIDSEKWESEKSDEAATEKREVDNLIENAIGEFDDFTKITLQVQGGKDDYISQGQQPKNSLISRYMGLDAYKMRYEYANEYFKEIKKKQKEVGDKVDIELQVVELEKSKKEKDGMLNSLKKEKEDVEKSKEKVDGDILDITKKIEKLDVIPYSDSNIVLGLISEEESNLIKYDSAISTLEKWLSENFKKELPFKDGETLESVNLELDNQQKLFKKDKDEYVEVDTWIKNNIKKELPKIDGVDEEISLLKEDITNLQNQLLTHKGKSCPTCFTVKTQPNPEKEKECKEDIVSKQTLISSKQSVVNSHKEISKLNDKYDIEVSKLKTLSDSLTNKKDKITLLKERVDLFSNMKEIIEHNKKVEESTSRLNKGKDIKVKAEKNIENLKDYLVKIKSNSEKQKNNKSYEEEIDSLSELLRAYKLTFHNLEKNINTVYGDIRVLENDIKIYSDKLISIKEAEKLFKKYSIYLQAMHRDGIPSLIIRKKLPIINNKINSILQQIVNFKVELDVLANGDITESFYYSEDKSDALPLQFASGAQKFVSSIAIKDALHFISSLTKPSMCIIDEGFGTLDTKLSFEIVNILQYLKNKHKNVILITHKAEIKDFTDNIIEVTKVKTGIPQEVLDSNPEAGTTKLSIT